MEARLVHVGIRRLGKRRGTTSLEYLAVISLILIALILAVQHLGLVTGGLFANNAKATSATIQTGP